jgi:hypothetical protein
MEKFGKVYVLYKKIYAGNHSKRTPLATEEYPGKTGIVIFSSKV